jgi:hypothetical protein
VSQLSCPVLPSTLLHQCLPRCRQQSQGLLPPGTAYDLFRGTAASQRDEVDAYPSSLAAKVTFGAKTHPEVAIFSPDGTMLVSGSSDGFIEVRVVVLLFVLLCAAWFCWWCLCAAAHLLHARMPCCRCLALPRCCFCFTRVSCHHSLAPPLLLPAAACHAAPSSLLQLHAGSLLCSAN